MSVTLVKSHAVNTKSAGKKLSNDPRLISYKIQSSKGVTLASDGELQTLVELLMMQTAKIAESIGHDVAASPMRVLKIVSGYYHAFYLQDESVRIGAIAEKSMSLEDFKSLAL